MSVGTETDFELYSRQECNFEMMSIVALFVLSKM